MPFPFIDLPKEEKISTEVKEVFKEFNWNFENNKFIYDRFGNVEILEGQNALKIWIYKALKTFRGMYMAYTWNFGADIETLITCGSDRELVKSEAKRMVKEALLVNEYILDCVDFRFSFYDEILTINFIAKTIYNDIDIEI